MSAEPAEAPAPLALFSLHDRTGSAELAGALVARGIEIIATSGTRRHLLDHGIPARDVGDLTGFPSLFGGRVKTLHPRIFGAILADRDDPAHAAEALANGVPTIGIVAVNLYPFEATVARPGALLQEAVEQIDIGGVALIRAAAKNFAHVVVLVDPEQYPLLRAEGGPDLSTRRRLATRAFERTAEYDSSIARYLEAGLLARELPGSLALTIPLATPLRYGENPQSRAAFYLARTETLPEQLGGKALSYNNLLDLDATLRLLVREVPVTLGLDEREQNAPHDAGVRAVVVKHTVPCGVAERPAAQAAVSAALETDRVSAFGGIVALDGRVDDATAQALAPFFLEIVAAPAFDDDALARLRRKKNLRIMRYDRRLPARLAAELRVRSALGGVLAEDDDPHAEPERWRIVSQRAPAAGERNDLRLAWDIVRHVKSNGVVLVRDGITRGICAGQTNRVSAVRIAGERAGELARGAACASDGFFPFADGLEAAVEAGCSAIIAPEGSIRDAEVIAAADRLGIALVFSTHRYFLH
ncbi:MAG: bifunctional phosphoribosylaminoimidazolecarboxamide formyltransferase/IMP cyclohydrolase [Candidatus Eremiobacteraeota bacterium]|nr:bifunctional phosphoribosylaminoimidazolecarboxamide formyltransferase/IMP cyclohydrolase [Candidatus Eremiobacteraeota bacterium]MBC5804097.1 bifunctional phosphoribosylaminoimidazolecarboxamide formyltransferase/IMP cyclohydrolase [Candidatus Eremiobacteraeota bacterium]MBC5822001.1 bifunctional phosphoribosylaminoimidazolecarboxamide formyltransferase/IMP cyclohydrolase [Candidatus Eremiobacteraeota bacterium]